MLSPELPALLLGAAVLILVLQRRLAGLERQRVLVGQVIPGSTDEAEMIRDSFADLVVRLLSPKFLESERSKLRAAGITQRVEVLVALRIAAVAVGSAAMPLAMNLGRRPTAWHGALVVAGALGGLGLSEWWVQRAIRYAQSRLRSAWPAFLARVRLCLAAGMPLELAIECVGQLSIARGNVLAEALAGLVSQVRAGVPLEQAVEAWARASGVNEVAVFAGALQRSRTSGVPLGASLEEQHRTTSTRLRQAYLTWVSALPSRLSAVAMVFFLPAVLVVVLLPSVIAFIRAGW